jgi:hypothetical protein
MKRALVIPLVIFIVCGCQNPFGPSAPTTAVATTGTGVNASITGVVARNDVFRAKQGQLLTVAAPGVLRNDSAPKGVTPSVDFVVSTLPPPFAFTNTNDGGFILDLSFTPDLSGAVSFDYLLHTATNDSNIATVTLQIAK